MTITPELLDKQYNVLQSQARVYAENKEYVKGCNPAILRQQRKRDPDNRIPVPLAKSAVDDMAGYAGSNIKIDYVAVDKKDNDSAEEKLYQEIMKKWQDWNDDNIITSRLYKEALGHREVYLLVWVDAEANTVPGISLTPEYELIGMNEMVIIWSNDIKPKKLAAIRYATDDNGEKTATVYLPEIAETWRKNTGNDSTWTHYKKEDISYPFKTVPVCIAKIDNESGPLFQAEKPIIDAFDSTISKSQNELDRFNALLMLFPDKVGAQLIKAMEELKVLDELGQYEADKWPKYLQKDMTGVVEFMKNHIDLLERLFHKSIKVVDFNNISAEGGDESGVARAFKLLGMEFKAKEIEMTFNKCFVERTELFDDILRVSNPGINVDKYKCVVTAKRNMPIDEMSKLAIAEGLMRLGVRKETILKVLPGTVIENIEAEIKEMEAKEKNRAEEFANMLNDGNDDN